jgi:hypothetical protein
MKAPDLRKWNLKPELQGLLLFAQLINELLFDFTLDTYKLPALNSRTLALELLSTIQEWEKGLLREGTIKPIVLELADRLKKDSVAKEAFKNYFEEVIEALKRDEEISEIKPKISLLVNKMEEKYFTISKKVLKEKIFTGKEKEEITRITRNYIIDLIEKGFSPQYIYFESERFFFSGRYPEKIDSPEVIDQYFALFPSEERKFRVLYRAAKTFGVIKGYAPNLGIEILENPPDLSFRDSARVTGILGKNEQLPLFLVVKDIEAFDEIKARGFADERLLLIDSLSKYHIHRGTLIRSEDAIVYSDDHKSIGVYKKPNPPVVKRPDRASENLADLINDTISILTSGKLDEESFSRLMRAFRRHDASLRAEMPENQLLEFWSAIEVLFPPTTEKADRIVQISGAMTNFISSEYAAKVASDLYRSLKNSGQQESLAILNDVPQGDNPIEKTLALFSIEDNGPAREKLYGILEWHPLLKNRIYYLTTKFMSADSVLRTMNGHIERVSWQIRRIYRTRNVIIHSGRSFPYIGILVENLHSYLDRVLDVVTERVSHRSHSTTIDEITLEMKLEWKSHMNILKKLGKEKCTTDNYKLILFGNK